MWRFNATWWQGVCEICFSSISVVEHKDNSHLVEDRVGVPGGVEFFQLSCDAVVFADEERVHASQACVLVDPLVPCEKTRLLRAVQFHRASDLMVWNRSKIDLSTPFFVDNRILTFHQLVDYIFYSYFCYRTPCWIRFYLINRIGWKSQVWATLNSKWKHTWQNYVQLSNIRTLPRFPHVMKHLVCLWKSSAV